MRYVVWTAVLRGFSQVTRDITDHIRAREAEAAKIAAEKSSKAKDDFLAALSHELRTPLTPALAAASYLVDNAEKLPSEFTSELNVIRRNVQLEARLIDDLLDLTRVTHGKVTLHFKRVDAHTCVKEALEIVRASIDEKDLKISMALEAENHHIRADAVRIEQVFWNLISNAVKFTERGGSIDIRTSNDADGRFQFANFRYRNWNRFRTAGRPLQTIRARRGIHNPAIWRPRSWSRDFKTSRQLAWRRNRSRKSWAKSWCNFQGHA